MKIVDLLENDEWTNQPITLEQLYGKYVSRVREFAFELEKSLKNSSPADTRELQNSLKLYREWFSYTAPTCWVRCGLTPAIWKHFPVLHTKWERVIAADSTYVKAGGAYYSHVVN